MAIDTQQHFKKPAGQDAYYPPESESPRRLLERAEIVKHLPKCRECNYPLNSKGECIRLGCINSIFCFCERPKEPGHMYGEHPH